MILDRDCYGITISANVIAHELGGGVDLRDAWGCAVSANTFTLVHQFGVRVGKNSGRITITGNTFTGMSREAVKSTGQCERILVLGNIFHDLSRRSEKKLPAVSLPGALKTIVKDNLK